MPRNVRILHRRPRTRRDRMVARLQATRRHAARRLGRMRRRRQVRQARRRAHELFLQLSESLRPEDQPAGRVRLARLHARHSHH